MKNKKDYRSFLNKVQCINEIKKLDLLDGKYCIVVLYNYDLQRLFSFECKKDYDDFFFFITSHSLKLDLI